MELSSCSSSLRNSSYFSGIPKGQALADLLWWMVHDGQQYAAPLTYVPLPGTIVKKDEAKIKSLKCGNSPCYQG